MVYHCADIEEHMIQDNVAAMMQFSSFSTGFGILSPAKAVRNLNQLHTFQNDLPTVVRKALSMAGVLVFFAIAVSMMVVSFF
jgi:hypothetical protein